MHSEDKKEKKMETLVSSSGPPHSKVTLTSQIRLLLLPAIITGPPQFQVEKLLLAA